MVKKPSISKIISIYIVSKEKLPIVLFRLMGNLLYKNILDQLKLICSIACNIRLSDIGYGVPIC